MARNIHVTVMCLPPRCSHRMQPLSVSFIKPLITYYIQSVGNWLRKHLLFAFAAAAPTNIELMEDVVSHVARDGKAPQAVQQTDRDTVPCAALAFVVAETPRDTVLNGTGMDMPPFKVPGCGSLAPYAAQNMLAPAVANTDVATNVDVNGTEPQQHTAVPITTVSPISEVAGHTARKSHRRGKNCIITLSPYKRELEQKMNSQVNIWKIPRQPPNKLLQKVSQLILVGFSVLYDILKVYQSRTPGKVVLSRWRPRWPPKLLNDHNYVTINSNLMISVSIHRF